jgi:hypothetical protein
MDVNNIFNLFNEDYINNDDETSLLIDFSEHPLYKISGFNKIINNHLFFKNYTVKIFKNIPNDLNLEEIEKAGEYLMFEKAWGYIKDINLKNPFHVECICKKVSPDFLENLDISIKFFEEYEEYEKCALLKGIEEKVREFSL